jgi:hypothetical protein
VRRLSETPLTRVAGRFRPSAGGEDVSDRPFPGSERDVEAMATADERKALNESTFRRANEQLEDKAIDLLGLDDTSFMPFLCECPRQECREVVLVAPREYEHVRSDPRWTITAAGHEDPEIERVVDRNDRFLITEKFGLAAEVAVEEDPRS